MVNSCSRESLITKPGGPIYGTLFYIRINNVTSLILHKAVSYSLEWTDTDLGKDLKPFSLLKLEIPIICSYSVTCFEPRFLSTKLFPPSTYTCSYLSTCESYMLDYLMHVCVELHIHVGYVQLRICEYNGGEELEGTKSSFSFSSFFSCTFLDLPWTPLDPVIGYFFSGIATLSALNFSE